MKKLFALFLMISMLVFTSYAQTDCNPATITKVEREGTGNRINWTLPPSGEEVAISQNEDSKGTAYGSSHRSLGVYHRFTPEHLTSVNDGLLTQIIFVPSYDSPQTEPGHTYTVQIYQGGFWGEEGNRDPGTIITSQELNNENLLFNEENTITLVTPVTIDATQELWIGYYCTIIDPVEGVPKWPVGCDDGPKNDGFGNICFIRDQWYIISEISSSFHKNWVIKGIVKTIDEVTVNIVFNNEIIETNISGTTFLHSNPVGEEHCYELEVNCLEGGVSPLSNRECIPGVGIIDNEKMNITIYPNPAKNELKIENGEWRIKNVEIYDVYGRMLKAESRRQKAEGTMVVDISNLTAGIYFVKIYSETGITIKKVIIEN